MLSFKHWRVVPFAACLSLVCACSTAANGGTTDEMSAAPAVNAGSSAPTTSAPAGSAGKPAATGAAGMRAANAAGSSWSEAGAGASAGAAGSGDGAPVRAAALLEPFMARGMSTGAAGSGETAGTSGGGAGAAGDGTGAGIAALSGTATFTKAAGTQVDLSIELSGCEDGKAYPVHIHEGTSCDSVESQGGHWGVPQSLTGEPTGAAGSGASAAGGAGHDASHAGAGGSAGAPSARLFDRRGEGIPDIQCSGSTGMTLHKRNTFDKRVIWTIGTGEESDVVGHVVVVHDGDARIACGKIELQ